MIHIAKAFLSPWTWRMAWRDSRASRRRLVLFSFSIVLGIAALTAIGSLGANLERAIQEQSKALLGADLVIISRQPFDANEDQLFREIGGVQSREINFSSMVYFSSTEGTRLVQVRALEPGFPFYGVLETDPPSAAAEFRKSGGALVEESLLTQFGAKVGEELRLGKLTTGIAGSLKKVPGESVAFATIAPRVYIPMTELPRADLLREGSLARYRVFFQFPPGFDVGELLRRIKPQLDEYRLNTDTVDERQRELGRSMERMYHFLNLVGFVALLLGGVGVASAIHVHVKEKLGTVAVLRCLGGTVPQTFAIYLAQGMALGIIGALAGAGLGLIIQSALPRVLGDFIPFAFDFRTSWPAVGKAVGIGFAICLLFALMPLLAVRRVSPLTAIRVAFEPAARRDPLRWLLGLLLAAGVLAFAVSQAQNWRIGLGFAVGLGVVFALLAATARGLIFVVRRLALARLPFTVRQGISNLHRPNNRTLLLLLSLGLGTFLIVSLFLVQQNLLTQLISTEGNQQANAVLFDIQPDQREPITNLVRSLNLPIIDEAPIINMRVRSVKGETVESLLKNRQRGVSRWPLRREYRSTYNDRLRDAERLIAGTWHTNATEEPFPVSLEQGIANELRVGIGDEIEFDVQGVPVKTRVASLREVNWRRVQPNFFVVFPRGALESAPAMHVLVTRVRSSEESARLQREVVKRFPNVSVIDLSLILQTLDSILGKISFVIRFMAMFTVVTGLLVLAGALLTGRYQRIQESVLLRTLGASRKQIFHILLVEYFVLGLLAALTGVILAMLAAWALAVFVFKMDYAPAIAPLLIPLLGLPLLTVGIGFLMNRMVVSHPPLSILNAQVLIVLAMVWHMSASAAPSEPALASITTNDLLKHTQVLASDEFEGRAPGSPGEERTLDYLLRHFKSMGLQPGNPDGSYFQNVPLVGISGQPEASLGAGGKPLEIFLPRDCVVWSRRLAPEVNVPDTDVVFVGYGIIASEYRWDDFKDVDVRGKTILMLVNDPPIPDPTDPARLDEKMFKGRGMTYYGRWTYKYEIATQKGAAAAIIVHETGPAGYPWAVVVGSNTRENMDLKAAGGNMDRVAVEGWMTVDTAIKLCAAAGEDYQGLKQRALRRDFRPVPLKAKATWKVANKWREISSRNVVAKLDGSDAKLKSEVIIYTAHWDHLGRNPNLQGDQVYNGALDNASGTAALLELAEAFTKTRPKRTVLFLAVTAEEKGLLGARYYASHPLYPLERTLANINIDGVNVLGRTRDLGLVGVGQSSLEDLLREFVEGEGRKLVPEAEPEKGYYYRSDHFEFAKVGVPALYTDEGIDYIGKPSDFGKNKRAEYIEKDYHKVTDEIKPDWELSGAVEDIRLLFQVGDTLAQGHEPPTWKEGSEFKSRRR